MKSTGSKVVSWLLFVAGMAGIFACTHFAAPASFSMVQNITAAGAGVSSFFAYGVHCLWYILLFLLAWWGFTALEVEGFGKYAVAVLACSLFAASDEVHQLLLVKGTFDKADLVLDICVVLVAAVLAGIVEAIVKKRKQV